LGGKRCSAPATIDASAPKAAAEPVVRTLTPSRDPWNSGRAVDHYKFWSVDTNLV